MKTITTAIFSLILLVTVNTATANSISPNNEVSPNFSKKSLSVSFTSTEIGNAVIKMQSVTGQTIATKNTNISKGNNTVQLENMTGLSQGIYIAQVSVNGVVVNNQKVIIY